MSSFVNAAAAATIGVLVGAVAFYGVSSIDTDNLADGYGSHAPAATSEPSSRGGAAAGDDARPVESAGSDTGSPVTTAVTPEPVDATVGELRVVDEPSVAEPYTFTPPPVYSGDIDYRANRPADTRDIPVPEYQPVQYCLSAALGLGYLDPSRIDTLIAHCLATFPA